MSLPLARDVQTEEHSHAADAKTYRVIAFSLFRREIDIVDRATDILQRGGWPKANRSLVVREALQRLEEELEGLTAEEVFRNVVDRHARRAGMARDTRSGRHASESPEGACRSGV